jgi:small subunit ribosomal protein S18
MSATEEAPGTEAAPQTSSGGGGYGGGGGGRGRGSYIRKPRVCQFCIEKTEIIDYKQADMLRKFVMERGKIRPRRQTGTCARHQRALAVAVKRARHMALLPFADE